MIIYGNFLAVAKKRIIKELTHTSSSKKNTWGLFDLFVPLNQIAANKQTNPAKKKPWKNKNKQQDKSQTNFKEK